LKKLAKKLHNQIMEDNELRNLLKKADTKASLEPMNETVVAKAAMTQRKAPMSYRGFRALVGSLGAAALVVGITLPSALQPQPLFELASSGSSGRDSAIATQESSVAADSAMIWPGWFEYNYIAQGLSTEGSSGEIFEVRKKGNPTQILSNVAAVFGIQGEPKQDDWSTAEYPSYSISGEDFSISIYWSGPGGWYFSRWNQDYFRGCAEPVMEEPVEGEGETDSTMDESYVCEEIKPEPGLIPSEQEMLSQAENLFSTLGVDFDRALARVWRDDWGGSVSMPMILDGNAIPLESYIGWGSDGEVSYASGYSVEIVSRGNFDTISATDAVERISDWRWYGSVASSYYEQYYASTAVAESAIERDAAASGGEDSASIDEPMPVEPEQPTEPEIVDVFVNRSETALAAAYDGSGNMWLVPAYILHNDQGWFDVIIAVEEGVIQLPEPYDIMPLNDTEEMIMPEEGN
jgi:hypothetical protein